MTSIRKSKTKAGKKRSRRRRGFIDFEPGTLNIILTAPHGGSLKPKGIPDRTHGYWDGTKCVWDHSDTPKDKKKCKAILGNDSYTYELTLLIKRELFKLSGQYPYTVINLLHRKKLDANRKKDEATFGVPVMEKAWEEFHSYIDQSKSSFTGPGLLIDIHGHGHHNQWVELGYLLTAQSLNSGAIHSSSSSIRRLHERTHINFEELLMGEGSFGGLLNKEGYHAVPGPIFHAPYGEKYFAGGYNTMRHGSRDGGKVDAIQIETPTELRSPKHRRKYAAALARVIYTFYQKYYLSTK